MEPFELTYSELESWENLHATGQALLTKFGDTELPKLGKITAT